jgi:hypothetical protein
VSHTSCDRFLRSVHLLAYCIILWQHNRLFFTELPILLMICDNKWHIWRLNAPVSANSWILRACKHKPNIPQSTPSPPPHLPLLLQFKPSGYFCKGNFLQFWTLDPFLLIHYTYVFVVVLTLDRNRPPMNGD